jgi:hypothetical protein
VTVDEGDHFAGSAPTNPGCNGTPVGSKDVLGQPGTGYCDYASNIGETDVNLNSMVEGKNPSDTTPFDEDYDDAPTVFVQGQPGADDTATRNLEKDMSGISEFDPSTGSNEPIVYQLADQETEKILHMWNAGNRSVVGALGRYSLLVQRILQVWTARRRRRSMTRGVRRVLNSFLISRAGSGSMRSG